MRSVSEEGAFAIQYAYLSMALPSNVLRHNIVTPQDAINGVAEDAAASTPHGGS